MKPLGNQIARWTRMASWLALSPLLQGAPAVQDASARWALQPVVRPALPLVQAPPGWTGNPVDAFVSARLREAGLSPSPTADRGTLVRRVTFDLTGLPPSPEETDAFERDRRPDAYERLVDRLLASPRHGERWARHWLDVVRFTESQGFEYDRLRDNAWPYRDYVVRSFNADKPYDLFMREQIAGDVIEPVTADGIIATSLLVCGAWDQAGNSQANMTQRAITREEEMEDLVSVVGQTFLGLTINCARCHDHKFDPVPSADYYRVKAVFDGVRHGERPVEGAEEAKIREAAGSQARADLAEAQAAIARIEAEGAVAAAAKLPAGTRPPGPAALARWTFGADTTPVSDGKLEGGAVVAGGRLLLPAAGAFLRSPPLDRDLRAKTLEAWVALADLEQRGGAAISVETADGSMFDAIVFGERRPRRWMAGSEGHVRTQDLDVPDEQAGPAAMVHLAAVYSTDDRIALYRDGVPYGAPYKPSGGLRTFKAGDARVALGRRHQGGGSPWLTGAIGRAALYDRALSADEVAASFRAEGASITQDMILAGLDPAGRRAREDAMARAKTARAAIAFSAKPVMTAYAGKREQPAPTKALKRGDVKSPGEIVAPSALSAVAALPADLGLAPDAPEAGRRIGFAAWLADPRNPLPARVMVNRVWQAHLGQGLVTTPSDLGASGARPSHPELLDRLASDFVAGGWSLKALHRIIVTSAAYRQASASRPEAAAKDADDTLLWRFPPRRLEAEAVRDSMLAVSGDLNLQLGGPSFRPFTTSEYGAMFYHLFDKGDAENNRRTVYRMNIHSGKEPLLDAFDCPDPSVKTPRRGITTTPLQALGLMNSSFVQRQAGGLAERSRRLARGDLSRAVGTAYRLALGRAATPAEQARAVAAARERGLANVCWVLLNSTEFVYVR